MRIGATLGLLSLVLVVPVARATPGPDTTVVVANANVPESVALAQRYAVERDVPSAQVCLLDVVDEEDVALADYETTVLEPLRACLDATPGVRARIEAAVLIRGIPLRVQIPVGGGMQPVSLAAALQLWDSTLDSGDPVLGQDPGEPGMCGPGVSCYAPAWDNPYRGFPFEPGWTTDRGGATWRPILVTMLHGRSYEAAEGLLDSALSAEASPPPTGEMLFMEGADAARGRLDAEYDRVIMDLTALGFTATRVPFERDLTGHTLSSFVTGTAGLGMTIEGNTYLPGSIVDNLTSFGAVPQNFRETGESQVSIARWVEQGVAGVHGTVAEPLNGCFPHRRFLVEYVLGATLAEAYLAMMPNVYWRNLVLGDPMAAPYAQRPEVTIEGVSDGEALSGAVAVHLSATDPGMRGIGSIAAFLDGEEVLREASDDAFLCLGADGDGVDRQLLVVARAADDPTEARVWQPKGWVALTLRTSGVSACPTGEDAGVPPIDDAGAADDGGTGADAGMAPTSDGCACRATPTPARGPAGLLVLALLGLAVRARRSF
ncbi:MAG: MYXO-CTERM sorting domain-containing protein [Sandaracinaceae bacterium]